MWKSLLAVPPTATALPLSSAAFVLLLSAGALLTSCQVSPEETAFRSDVPDVIRPWIGAAYWSNPMQDWQIRDGRIECLTTDSNRNVALLTRRIAEGDGDFRLRVRMGMIEENERNLDPGWAGFRIGTRGEFNDYRDDAIFGRGLNTGMTTAGKLFVGERPTDGKERPTDGAELSEQLRRALGGEGVFLDLAGVQRGANYDIRLRLESADGEILDAVERSVPGDSLSGGLALVAHYDRPEHDPYEEREYYKSFWFDDWQIDGERIESHPDRAYGPILFALHTLSEGTLNMSAQLPPVSSADGQSVRLDARRGGQWQQVAEAPIDQRSRTASLRVPNWPDSVDVPYRLAYQTVDSQQEHYWEGTVRKDPTDKEEIVVAGFTGNNDVGFPHHDLVERVRYHDPDILLFTGDNIYETVGGYGYIHSPLDKSVLDYLRKWYMFGWEYRNLTKDIPAVTILDDHDVFQGNIWGAGGKQAMQSGTRKQMQDSGGYLQSAEWVNAAQRTQTAHLPEPYDATPVEQGINVYYTDLNYGGISFAIVEDRKWKTAPATVLPAYLNVVNGWAENQPTNLPQALRAPEAKLLGERQLDFLDAWAADWSNGTWMKVLMSQTIFANVATLPDTALSDVVVPRLEILGRDEYAANDRIVQDMDSNGWPKEARDEAVRTIRKGFAFHLAGDQHLGSTIQYGVDEWGDAGYAVCVPSVANFYPRRWYPPMAGQNRREGAPRNTGDFLDGFGNHMTVLAVSNPYDTGMEPSRLYDRAPGYGIVKLNRERRDIEIANWPRHVDPSSGAPYEGWPITINQMDNYGREAAAWLPTLRFEGMDDPVVQVVDEANREVVYTVRANGTSFDPKVFRQGTYTVRAGDPDTGMVERTGIASSARKGVSSLELDLRPGSLQDAAPDSTVEAAPDSVHAAGSDATHEAAAKSVHAAAPDANPSRSPAAQPFPF